MINQYLSTRIIIKEKKQFEAGLPCEVIGILNINNPMTGYDDP